MAQGTPVVAIAELGTASILIEGKGALIAPDDTWQFSEKVNQLLTYPAHRFELGKQAKIYALDKWTAKLQAQRMIGFYMQMISSKDINSNLANIQSTTQKNSMIAKGVA